MSRKNTKKPQLDLFDGQASSRKICTLKGQKVKTPVPETAVSEEPADLVIVEVEGDIPLPPWACKFCD